MSNPPRSYLVKGPKPEEARKIIIAEFDRYPGKALLVGPLSMLLGRTYGLNETEALLETMSAEGILRRALPSEVVSRQHLAYVLLKKP